MSSTTQPTTFADLYTDLLNRTRQDTSASATVTQAKRYVNIGLLDMHIGFGEKFPWAERRATILTTPVYSTGTLAISQGTTLVTGTGTAFSANNDWNEPNCSAGGKLRVSGGHEVYHVTQVSTVVSMTIGSKFIPADVSGASYSYYEDEYALASDFLRPIDMRRFSNGQLKIDLVGRTDFRRRFGANHEPGRPQYATIIDLDFDSNTTPRRRIKLSPPPDGPNPYQIHYEYVTSNLAVDASGTEQVSLASDTDEPIVPLRYRMAIVLHGLYHWYRDKKNDTRSAEVRAEYVDLLSRIAGDTEIGQQHTRIHPNVGAYRSRARRPWNGRHRGRFDVNGRFDRMEW
jgi:hypothetical protein